MYMVRSQPHGGNLFLKLSDMPCSFSLGHLTANYFIRPWLIGHSLSWLRWDGLDGMRTKTRWNVNLNWAPLTNRTNRFQTFWTWGFPQEYLATRRHCRLKLNKYAELAFGNQTDLADTFEMVYLIQNQHVMNPGKETDPDWIDLGAFH